MNIKEDLKFLQKDLKLQYLTNNNLYKKISEKWKNVIKIYGINNPDILETIAVFIEKYSILQDNWSKIQLSPMQRLGELPDEFIRLEDVLLILSNKYKEYVKDVAPKIDIKNKYYNYITGCEGILLENGDRVENGELLNTIMKDSSIIQLKLYI